MSPDKVHDLIESMKDCPSDIPLIVTDGNHDIGNTAFMKHAWMGYEKQFGELWYNFIVSRNTLMCSNQNYDFRLEIVVSS